MRPKLFLEKTNKASTKFSDKTRTSGEEKTAETAIKYKQKPGKL